MLDGPVQRNGQPSWTLHDPVRHRFLRIDWTTYEVLRRWWMACPDTIAAQVNAQTTLAIGPEHVRWVLAFARAQELVLPEAALPAATGHSLGQWLLHHYLFFRVPLVNPDRQLQRLLPRVRPLASHGFGLASLIALFLGVLLAWRNWEAFGAQAVDLLSWQGLALYGMTVVAVKFAHECGHAFTAKHHGCRVPTMGLAFMVLWPVAYTDTSEIWRRADRRARLQVALAGIRTELTIAAWSTLAWGLLPDGALRTSAFILATSSWISTVAVNFSPFMRFDGYFILCDWLDEPNLHERSFAMARWWLRRLLLGWPAPPPEPLSKRRRGFFIAFALLTWMYRLALYLTIAALVYHFAVKALGIVLFVVELGFFIVMPNVRELKAWYTHRREWQASRRVRNSMLVIGALAVLACVPLPTRESAGAMLQPAAHLEVRLPAAAVINGVAVRAGEAVAAGQVLLDTHSSSVTHRIELANSRLRQLQAQLAGASVDVAQQAQWGSLQASLVTARAELQAAHDEAGRLRPAAPFDAVVLEVDPTLQPGEVVGSQQVLMQLASARTWRVVAYVSEAAADGLGDRQQVSFVPDADPRTTIPMTVVSVAPHPSAYLAEPALSRSQGGSIETTREGNHWRLERTLYRVELAPAQPIAMAPRQWRGHVTVPRAATSVAGSALDGALAVLTREFGF